MVNPKELPSGVLGIDFPLSCDLYEFGTEDGKYHAFAQVADEIISFRDRNLLKQKIISFNRAHKVNTMYAKEQKGNYRITLPAGEYYVGDPSYICPCDIWQEILETTKQLTNHPQVFKSRVLFCHTTAYGDGRYENQARPESYGVDSSTLGIVPMELVWKMNSEVPFDDSCVFTIKQLGSVITFEEDFEASVENGVFTFGDKVLIDTNENSFDFDRE